MPALVLAALLQIADVQPARIEHASADDCAIFVTLGREKFGWGPQTPQHYFQVHSQNYVFECPWQGLGVAPPPSYAVSSSVGLFSGPNNEAREAQSAILSQDRSRPLPMGMDLILRPVYYGAGLFAHTTVSISTSQTLTEWDCTVYKYGGQWRVKSCDPITTVAEWQPGTGKQASPDDCAVMALAGKETLGWGTERPKYALSSGPYSSDGRPIFDAKCQWRDFGVVPPEISGSGQSPSELTRLAPVHSTGLPGWISKITRPKYDPSGMQASASVALVKPEAYFDAVREWNCDFSKYGGQWRLSGCKTEPDLSSH